MTTQAPNERDSRGLLREIQEVSTNTSNDSGVNRNVQSESIQDSHPSAKPRPNNYTLKCVFAASITSSLLGFEIGAMSETVASIKKDHKTSDRHVEIVTVILYLLSLLGSVMAGWTSNRIGRRYTIILVGFIFFTGPFLMAIGSNYGFLLLGRFFAQVGAGYTLMIAPVYIAEVSPAFFRGLFSSLPEVFVNLGIIIGYIANYFFSKLLFSGRVIMLYVGTISLALLAIAVLTMPESPRWLIMEGRLDDGKRVLARTSDSPREAALQLADIMEAAGIPRECNDEVVNVQRKGVWQNLFRPTRSVRHMLYCAIGIQIARQASGIDTILLYSPRIFEKAGVTFSDDKLLWTIALDSVKTIFILVATFLLDKVGRRWLLLSSIGGMIVSLISLGKSLNNIEQSDPKYIDESNMKHKCIASLFIYVASYSVGMGPITLVYNSELFPLRLRAQGCAIAFAANQLMSAIISLTFLLLDKAITLGGAAFLFAAAACIAWLLFFIIMPETLGRTLEEMGQFFGECIQWKSVAREIEMQRSAAREIEMERTMGRRD